MKKFSKLLPIGGFVIAVALASITSAFKDAPKNLDEQLWVLKSGAPVGSTEPSDYEPGNPTCTGQIHFCAFEAPAKSTTPTEPDIEAVPNLTEDLQFIHDHPNNSVNDSDAMRYKDAS